MPSLKAIRTRIASVKNTQKITRAMKLVAAARMRRAQESIIAARPYARRLGEVISEVAARHLGELSESAAGQAQGAADEHAAAGVEQAGPHQSTAPHPLLERRVPKRAMLLVLTSDRGLCGGFNSNIARRAERFLKTDAKAFEETVMAIVGRKGREYFRRRKMPIRHEFAGVTSDIALERAREITRAIIRDYTSLNLDAIYLVYNEFKSAIQQRVVVEPLLPVEPPAAVAEAQAQADKSVHGAGGPGAASPSGVDFIYEPSKTRLLDTLLPLHVEIQIYRAILESIASEFGARMTAMDSATKNASEMIARLTLSFNRARQASITKELMEIVSGAEALK